MLSRTRVIGRGHSADAHMGTGEGKRGDTTVGKDRRKRHVQYTSKYVHYEDSELK